MSDRFVRLIRTWVPMALGWLVSWLFGIAPWLEDVISINIEAATLLVVALFYALASYLSKLHPVFAWFLGLNEDGSLPPIPFASGGMKRTL